DHDADRDRLDDRRHPPPAAGRDDHRVRRAARVPALMKHVAVVVSISLAVLATGCKTQKDDPGGPARIRAGGSGGDTAGSEVACSDAAKKFTALMAASPGELADLKPDE